MLCMILFFAVIYFTVGVMSDFGKIRDMCIATHLHVLVYRSSVVATTNDSMPPHIQPKWAIKTIFIEVNWKFIQNDTI